MFQRHEILFIHLNVYSIIYIEKKILLIPYDNHFKIGSFVILTGFILMYNCKCHQNTIIINNYCIKKNLSNSF